MSGIRVSNLRGETSGSAPTFPDGVIVTGVTTSTSFNGNLTGDVTGNITGNISGATGSFTGNVSVGGTLTYEDVTNVDSVGIITAQAGIKIGAGQSISAVSGVITYYGDGSQLEGIQSGTADFVGFGTLITAGTPVIVRTDGKVQAVEGSGVPDAPTVGTDTQFESGAAIRMASVFHPPSSRTIIGFADYNDSSKGKSSSLAVTGGSTNTVAAGSVYEWEAGDMRFLSMAYDPDTQRVIYHYADNGNNNYCTWRVSEVENDGTMHFSSPNVYYSAAMGQQSSAVYDTTNNRIVFMWPNGTSELRSTTGTVTGGNTNSLTLGNTQTVESGSIGHTSALWHSAAEKTIIFYQHGGQSNHGYYSVGTHNGQTGSSDGQNWSTAAAFTSTGITNVGSVYDSYNERVVVAYRDTGNSNHGYARVGSLSGETITWGTAVGFNTNGDTDHMRMAFDASTNNIVISYVDANNSGEASVKVGKVNATDNSISFSSKVDISTTAGNQTVLSYDSTTQRVVVGYNQGNLSGTGRARVVQTSTGVQSNLTTENYIGLAVAGISSGATGTVTIPGGLSSGHSGLTTGRTYYVGSGGVLQLSAGSPSVVAGTSISSTQILVR